MPLWVVALLTVSVVGATVFGVASSWEERNYIALAFWALVGSFTSAKNAVVFVKVLRSRR